VLVIDRPDRLNAMMVTMFVEPAQSAWHLRPLTCLRRPPTKEAD
jgi:hypothetical protein